MIDDEDFIRELVRDFLELEDIQCDEAKDAARAIELISAEKYDLILLDRHLGKIKAETVLSGIKEVSPTIPIVLLTGDPQYDKEYIEKFGVNDVILKPFQVDSFMEKITRFLETK